MSQKGFKAILLLKERIFYSSSDVTNNSPFKGTEAVESEESRYLSNASQTEANFIETQKHTLEFNVMMLTPLSGGLVRKDWRSSPNLLPGWCWNAPRKDTSYPLDWIRRWNSRTYLEVGVPDEVIFVDSWLLSSPRLISDLSLSIPTHLNLVKEGLIWPFPIRFNHPMGSQ